MNEWAANIEARSLMSDEELLRLLAEELYGSELGALPGRHARERAARWLDRLVDEQREQLCSSPAVLSLLDNASFDQIQDAAVISDALATAVGAPKGLALATAAVILSRRGLQAICRSTRAS